MNLRFWENRANSPEIRESQPFTDAITAAIVNQAGGSVPGDPGATAALEVAAGMYSRAFALATVRPAMPALNPHVLALIGRNLIRRGESLHLLEIRGGSIELIPAGSWDVRGGDDPARWYYRLDLFGPSGNRTKLAPARQVIHCRYSYDPARPWLGLSPLQWARETGRLHANAEKMLADETGGPRGYFLPLPQGDDEEDDDDEGRFSLLKADIKSLNGRLSIVETTSAGYGEGRESAPRGDYQVKRVGADPPATIAPILNASFLAVLGACGIPAELVTGGAGNAGQMANRRWQTSALAAVAELVADELRLKLELPHFAMSFERLESAEILQAKGRALKSFADSGIELEEAKKLAGLRA